METAPPVKTSTVLATASARVRSTVSACCRSCALSAALNATVSAVSQPAVVTTATTAIRPRSVEGPLT